MSTPDQSDPLKLATIYDVAAALKVSPATVRRTTKDGRLHAIKLGPGRSSPIRILPGEVARLLQAGLR